MQPLPLTHKTTASWCSYRPSAKKVERSSSDSDETSEISTSSYKTYFLSPSYYNSNPFEYERSDPSNSDNNNITNHEEDDESSNLFAASAAAAQAAAAAGAQQQQHQQAAAAEAALGTRKTSKLEAIKTIWARRTRRHIRKTEIQSHNLLYLALTDPALARAALLAKEEKPHKSLPTAGGK